MSLSSSPIIDSLLSVAIPASAQFLCGRQCGMADLDHDYVWVLANEQDRPIGFAIAHTLDESVHLHELDVHPHYARQGLGRRLIEAIADWARTRGATALTLTTFSDVLWNGPYYSRLGFRALDVATLNPALRAVWRAEESAGLPMAHRICMQLDL
jgi:GNAT superfamily N-acetyltransferase